VAKTVLFSVLATDATRQAGVFVYYCLLTLKSGGEVLDTLCDGLTRAA
jgi:hypothetical protein